jgi:hypothetical protein
VEFTAGQSTGNNFRERFRGRRWPAKNFSSPRKDWPSTDFPQLENAPNRMNSGLVSAVLAPSAQILRRAAVDWLHSIENTTHTGVRFLLTAKLVLVKGFSFFDSFLSPPVGGESGTRAKVTVLALEAEHGGPVRVNSELPVEGNERHS